MSKQLSPSVRPLFSWEIHEARRVFGDGLLVMFGMPETLPDYALHAVRAAVRMALASEQLQALWPLRSEEALEMGMGLHCGQMIDAIVGSGKRSHSLARAPTGRAIRIVQAKPRPPSAKHPRVQVVE